MAKTVVISDLRAERASLSEIFPAENTVTLEQLQFAKITVDWFEATAIVQALCEVVAGRNDDLRLKTFAPAHVLVHSDGTVDSTATPARSSIGEPAAAVQCAGILLRDLLPDTFPTPLRLALTQAVSAPPLYASIKEFSEALRYFERPDRASLISAVFQRWRAHADNQRSFAGNDDSTAKPREHRIPAREAPGNAQRRRAAMMWGITVAATVTAALATWIGFASAGIQNPVVTFSAAGAAAVEAGTTIAGSLIDRIVSLPSESPAVSSTAAPAVTPAPAASAITQAPIARVEFPPSRPRPVLAEPPLRQFSSPSLFDAFGVLEPPLIVPREELAAQPPLPPTPAAGSELEAVLDPAVGTPIYSAVDADVAPPVAVYPHLPASAFVARDDALGFDVVIDHSGNVESVRAREQAMSMGGALRLMMSLSAAKSWRFQPAIKGGQTVRYRHSIWIPAP